MPNCPSCDDVEMVETKGGSERVCPNCGYREDN